MCDYLTFMLPIFISATVCSGLIYRRVGNIIGPKTAILLRIGIWQGIAASCLKLILMAIPLISRLQT